MELEITEQPSSMSFDGRDGSKVYMNRYTAFLHDGVEPYPERIEFSVMADQPVLGPGRYLIGLKCFAHTAVREEGSTRPRKLMVFKPVPDGLKLKSEKPNLRSTG